MTIEKETRRESYHTVKPSVHQRQSAVLEILQEYGEMTAQEVADELYRCGLAQSNERNLSAPRLTELRDAGKVHAVSKKVCSKTGRTVAVWAVRKDRTP